MNDKKVEVTEPIYSKDPKENEYIKERLQAEIKAVIDQQMATNKPKQATETFERLQEEGFTAEESYNLMAQLVSMEAAELFANRHVALHCSIGKITRALRKATN